MSLDWLPDIDWAQAWPTVAAVILVVTALVGLVLTALTLPGPWITLAVALVLWWWQPQLFEWWTLLLAALIAGVGELVEFAASMVGAAKAGATRKGALGAAVGTLIGAIAGMPFGLFIGAIVGGVLGAAIGATLAERGWADRSWREAGKAGAGAAIGRLVATVAKTMIAGASALVLCVGVVRG